ncbi:23266_t:CDS:2 [Rhizophagus irregularis]|nr:23266_t:CDS:2 [Rhizophagus irregularis]
MTTVYVLECRNNKYYVGKTSRSVDVRFEEHCNGSGSEWTWLHQPIRIVESEKTDNSHLELTKTLDYMNKYGIDNCGSTDHFANDCNDYFDESDSSCDENDNNKVYRCFRCGSPSHFANDCDDESDSSFDENNGYSDDDERSYHY